MNCWEILGIEPTDDITAIRNAFAAQSKLHHPEDDPEGFQHIRQAYRHAMELVKYQSNHSESSITPPPAMKDHLDQPETRNTVPFIFPEMHIPEPVIDESVDSVFDYSAIDHIENQIESTYKFGMDVQADEFLNQARKRQRRKHIKVLFKIGQMLIAVLMLIMSALFIRDFNADKLSPGLNIRNQESVTCEQIETLKKQALVVLSTEADYRLGVLEQLTHGVPYTQSSAAILQISESDYLKLLEEVTANNDTFTEKLEAYRPSEISFVQEQILPVIKSGIISNQFIQVLQLGAMVGMDYGHCFTFTTRYIEYKDDNELNEGLRFYDHLVSPEQWDSYLQ